MLYYGKEFCWIGLVPRQLNLIKRVDSKQTNTV